MRTQRILWLIAGLFLLIGVLTINDYGITWDEPENFMIGRIYLNVYLHPLSHILSHPNELPLPPPVPFRLETHYERYPPFADTVASLTSYFLSERTTLLNTIAAHHLAALLFASMGIIATGLIAWELTNSPIATIAASLALASYPLYVGLSHTDIKDIPGAAMFTLSVYWLIRAIKKPSYFTTICAGMIWGAALATKITAIFAPVIVACALVFVVRSYKQSNLRHLIHHLAAFLLTAGVTLVVAWPWLMTDTISHSMLVYHYTQVVGKGLPVLFQGVSYRAGINTPWYYAPISIVIVTPVPMLITSVIGTFAGSVSIPIVWLIVVLGRYFFPSVTVYNGIRHFFEAVPALAVLSGIGIQRIISMFRKKHWAVMLCVLIFIIPAIQHDVMLHPYEMLYFNETVGGIKQASTHYEFDYWGFSVGELVQHLNKLPHTWGKTANVNWLDSPSWSFPGNHLTFVPTAAADYIIVPHSENYFSGVKAFLDTHATLIYTVVREDAEIGYLYEVKP